MHCCIVLLDALLPDDMQQGKENKKKEQGPPLCFQCYNILSSLCRRVASDDDGPGAI